MKGLIVSALFLILLSAGSTNGQTISQAERDRLVSHLEKTRKALEDATRGLSPAQWNFKPGLARWSIAQCVEHIALSEDFLVGIALERVLKTPAQPRKEADKASEGDAIILKRIPDRSFKAQAPEPLRPVGSSAGAAGAGPAQLLAQFEERRARTIAFAKTTQEDLRAHYADSQLMKAMDVYQWLLLVSTHSERHTAQLLEVKSHPNFPKE